MVLAHILILYCAPEFRVVGFAAVQLHLWFAKMSADHERRSGSELVTREAKSANAIATLGERPLLPNSGIPLELNWVQEGRVNTSAVERRAQTQVARRTVKKEWQAAWLLRAISCMDLTTLSGDDTDERVRRLCAKARQPVQPIWGRNLASSNSE
jgi:hypothetical protein